MSSKLGVVITIDDDDVPFVDVSSQIVDSPVSVVERDSLQISANIEQIIKTPKQYNTILESNDVEDNL
jgi:hypothetical protein